MVPSMSGLVEDGASLADFAAKSEPSRRYLEPGWFTRNILNMTVKTLTQLGISLWGSHILEIRGRKSGLWRAVPVNVLNNGCAT